jgi:diguanylate cyclase (GGDEF)-like protein
MRLLARFYVAEVLAVGAGVLAGSLNGATVPASVWPTFFVLAAAMAAAQFLPAACAGQFTSRPAVAFLVAGIALLPPPLLELLVIVAVLVDALHTERPLHVRLFEGATFLVAGRAAAVAYGLVLTYLPFSFPEITTAIALLVGALTLLAVARTFLRSFVVLTAPANRLLSPPLVDPSLVADLGMCCVGASFSVIWPVNPWVAPLAFLPIVPIVRGLKAAALEEEASTDPKTLLLNVRAFEARALKEFERTARNKRSAAFIVADLDFLRDVNNRYGHLAGDLVLQRVGDIIRACLPDSAFAARFGGEEFCILVPDADAPEGLHVAELIRRRIGDEQIALPTTGQSISVTISLGIATFPYNGHDLHTVMKEADAAVYRAKMSGRNRSCLAMLDGSSMPSRRATVRKGHRPQLAGAKAVAAARNAEVFAGLVALGGPLVALVILFGQPGVARWEELLLFAGLAVIADALAVEVCAERRISPAFITMLAGVYTFGVPAAVVIGTALAAFRGLLQQRNPRGFAVEFGALTVAGTAVSVTFHAFGNHLALGNILYTALPAAGAGMVGYLCHTLILAQAIGLEQRRNVFAVWNDLFRWLAGHHLLMVVLAIMLAAAYGQFGGYILAAFAVPVFSMRYAFKQYMDRSSQSEEALAKANQHLRSTYENTLLALVAALDARDHETEGHSERVANYAVRIGEKMGMEGEDLSNLRLGALLHDIGKIGLPDSVLRKNGPLTENEWRQMRLHPRTGFTILQGIEFLGAPSQIVVCHHEHYDGTGYPLGLKGEEIPLAARIFAVADAFDAITSDRAYRSAQSMAAAVAEVERCSGSQFDPRVVEAFVAAFSEEADAEYEVKTVESTEPSYGWAGVAAAKAAKRSA